MNILIGEKDLRHDARNRYQTLRRHFEQYLFKYILWTPLERYTHSYQIKEKVYKIWNSNNIITISLTEKLQDAIIIYIIFL